MKISMHLCLLGFVFLASTAQATDTIRDYKEAKKAGGERWVLIQIYIEGIAAGYAAANAYLATHLQREIYCVPQNLSLNIQNLVHILDKDIANPPIPIFNDDLPIELALEIGLQETFPCNSANRQ